jgi:hypothetical protein
MAGPISLIGLIRQSALGTQKQLLLASLIHFAQNLFIFLATISEAHAKLPWQRIFGNSAATDVAIQDQVKGAIVSLDNLKNAVLVRVFASPSHIEAPTELCTHRASIVITTIALKTEAQAR